MTELNHAIDHTISKPEVIEAAVQEITDEAKGYNSFSVCTNPCWVAFASERLANTDVAICTVIGSPLGASTPEVKAYEAVDATENGVNEADMIINIGALKSQQCGRVRQDTQNIVDVAKEKVLVKVITETALLIDEEKAKACELAKEASADFVKTFIDLSTGGAKVADIHLICETVDPDVGVKTSDCMHNAKEALVVVEVGATRIGASTDVVVVFGTTGEGY